MFVSFQQITFKLDNFSNFRALFLAKLTFFFLTCPCQKLKKKKPLMGLLETTVHLNPVVILLRQSATEILGKIDRSTSFSVFDCDQLVKIGHHCCKERLKISKLRKARGNSKSCLFDSLRLIPPPPPPPLSHSSRKALYVGNKLTTRRNS